MQLIMVTDFLSKSPAFMYKTFKSDKTLEVEVVAAIKWWKTRKDIIFTFVQVSLSVMNNVQIKVCDVK